MVHGAWALRGHDMAYVPGLDTNVSKRGTFLIICPEWVCCIWSDEDVGPLRGGVCNIPVH